MVFDRRFTAASPRYLGFSGSTANRQRWAMPVTEHLCPLDPALLNGVRKCVRLGARRDLDSRGRALRFWNGLALFSKPGDVEFDRLAHSLFDVRFGRPGRNAPWEVWRAGRIAGVRSLHHDQVAFRHLSPACLRTLSRVPAARSWLRFPATVTNPRFTGCLYWRWLPRVRTRYHPSRSRSLITSRTFT